MYFTATAIDDAHAQIGQLQSKVGQLEATLTARDQELSSAEARYRKSVEKTKEIIKTIDPKALAGRPLIDYFSNTALKITCPFLQLKLICWRSLPSMIKTHPDQWDQ